jgi:hypothetical protein
MLYTYPESRRLVPRIEYREDEVHAVEDTSCSKDIVSLTVLLDAYTFSTFPKHSTKVNKQGQKSPPYDIDYAKYAFSLLLHK